MRLTRSLLLVSSPLVGRRAAAALALGALLGCATASATDAPEAAPAATADDAPLAPHSDDSAKIVGGITTAAPGREAPLRRPRYTHDRVFDYFGGLTFDPGVPSPASVLGYEIGEHFTRHADQTAYLKALAAASDRVKIERYGSSHQRRPLHLVTISSPENLERLDEIVAANMELTDPRTLDPARKAEIVRTNPALVWFSYNVHGNEPSGGETALQIAYTVAAGTNEQIEEILDNTVIYIDPVLNPDGRERYVSWYQNTLGVGGPIADPAAAEHDEPWPGGRTNHYMFDLNRDWLWLVHPESASRLAAYRRVRPHLHIDFHEQGHLSPYFFGAGDVPYNQNIPDETKEWLDIYGAENARVFDDRGIVFATRERFDYLYPGYGKVLPVYHGAVGLLTEKGGHGRAGLAIEISDQYTLTLRERTHHHFLTSMSYAETTSARRQEQLERFARYFEDSMRPGAGEPHAFLISADNDPALLERAWFICRAHGIEIERLESDTAFSGLHSYRTGEPLSSTSLPEGSWIVRSGQPMGRLARALFERSTFVEDNETYDISGWSLPISFGLESYYAMRPVQARTSPLNNWRGPRAQETGSGDVAILIDAEQHLFPAAVGLAGEHDLFARRLGAPVEVDGRRFATGSLLVHGIRNPDREIDAFVDDVLSIGVDVHRTDSGMTQVGHVLGANDNWLAENSKALLLRGSPMSSYSFGQIWHLLDVEQPTPYVPVNADAFGRVDLEEFNVIVLPEAWGSMERALGEGGVERMKSWIRDGGTLVAVGSSAFWASDSILGIEGEEASEEDEEEAPANEKTFEQRREEANEQNMPGPMTKAAVDTTHPLATGVNEWVGVIKRARRPLPVAEDGFVIARFEEDPFVGGYMSEEMRDRLGGTPFVTHHRHGRGKVICFSDDITIRGFMHAPMRLLMNAITLGPSY